MQWRNDKPPTRKVVEVWFWNAVMQAWYDGATWRTVDNLYPLPGVTHWRERNA